MSENKPLFGAGYAEICNRCRVRMNFDAEVRRQVHEFVGREIEHVESVALNIKDHDALVVVMDLRGRLLSERAKLLNDIIDSHPPIYQGGGNA